MEDRDAPVYLYVPKKWHLEEKEMNDEIEVEEEEEEEEEWECNVNVNENAFSHGCNDLSGEQLKEISQNEGVKAVEIVTANSDFKQFFTKTTNPPLLYDLSLSLSFSGISF